MLITESTLPHIGQLDGTLGARIHEPVAALGVKLGSGDHLGQFLHVSRFDVHDVETLVLDIEVPEVDSKIVTADESLTIAVDGDAIDVIRMSI